MTTATPRGLIKGTNPEQVYPVPEFMGEYQLAEDLQEIGHALIERGKLRDFPQEPMPEILYLWKSKGGKSAQKGTFGKYVKLSGLPFFLSREADFVVWLAADHVKDANYTRYQVEALLYHELLHVDANFDEDNEFKGFTTKSHDLEVFKDEVSDYGFWENDITSFARVVQQRLPLED